MATIRFYQPADMINPYVWYGTITVANSSTVSITNYQGKTGNYYGYGISYQGNTVTGGVVTSYSNFNNYMSDYTVTDIAIPAAFVATQVQSGNIRELHRVSLADSDQFFGSNYSDSILAYSGNDYIIASGGNDYVDGGSGIDTAFFNGISSEYSFERSNGSLWVSDIKPGRDGIDLYSQVEIFNFSDLSLTIPQLDAITNFDGVFRFYNSNTGAHFYTGSSLEADSIVRNLDSFVYEGVAFNKNSKSIDSSVDVFRFYNQDTATHFYTASPEERDLILANLPSYKFEGVAYQAHGSKNAGTTELYRFYNTQTGTHFYTASEAEMQSVTVNLAGTYQFEGIAYYVDVLG